MDSLYKCLVCCRHYLSLYIEVTVDLFTNGLEIGSGFFLYAQVIKICNDQKIIKDKELLWIMGES